MLDSLLNIKNAVDSDSSIISLFNQLWSVAPVANTSSVYGACVLVIIMCMYAAGCRNLIYKVLNLAVLSVFVVALWAYLTDVTFIYVVYILTFVSAVVMLFLSVVLMLPSSAIAINSKNNVSPLLAMIFAPFNYSSVAALFTVLILIGYLLYALYRTHKYRSTYDTYGEPKYPVKFQCKVDVKNSSSQVLSLEDFYDLRAYANSAINLKAAESCLSYHRIKSDNPGTLPDYSVGDEYARLYNEPLLEAVIVGVNYGTFPMYVRITPNRFFNKPNKLDNYAASRFILYVAYEFINFYFWVLEPTFIRDFSVYAKLTSGLRRFAGVGAKMPTLWYDPETGWRLQTRFSIRGKKEIILVMARPWWSPFQVFRGTSNFFLSDIIIHRPLDFIKLGLERVKEENFFKNIAVWGGTHAADKALRLGSTLLAFVNFTKLRFSAVYAEIAAQVTTTMSLFLLAAPSGHPQVTAGFYSSPTTVMSSLENLAAIQYNLYVASPLFMIVSVTGLLVALIGAPLFVSPGHAAKKTLHRH